MADLEPTLSVSLGTGEEPSEAEYAFLRKNYRKLVDVVSEGDIPAHLFEKGIIDDDLLGQSGLTSSDYGKKLMQKVLKVVTLNPKKYFKLFCQALNAEPVGSEVLARLTSKYIIHIYIRTILYHLVCIL